MRSYSALTSYHELERHIEVSENQLREILELLLSHVNVDEEWYCAVNSDVREAIEAGKLESAKQHYAMAGYFEDRMPYPIDVDEAWYLEVYPDVAFAIQSGLLSSAQDHFNSAGFSEGRLPRAGWSLLVGSDLAVDHRNSIAAGSDAVTRVPRSFF